MIRRAGLITVVLVATFVSTFSQEQEGEKSFIQQGEVHGNFQTEFQYYLEDTIIGAPIVPEKLGMNAFANVNYFNGPITAGLRYESYQNALQGFPEGYKGNGIPYRYFMYNKDFLSFTAGHFYEQFGNGFIFRTYEERGLGYDNAMDGIRIGLKLHDGLYVKGVIGQQRVFFRLGEGIVRGVDAEWSLNEFFPQMNEGNHRLVLGGSFVSKYEKDQSSELILPENVGTAAARFNYKYKKVRVNGEYVFKINDPSLDNGYIYNTGEVIYLQTSYSKRGFGATASVLRNDNMSYKSERDMDGNNLLINYVPALTRQHTYNLLATLYPYATQLLGQMGAQVEVTKKFKRKTFLGGKYGTIVSLNFSGYNNIDTTHIVDPQRDALGLAREYTSERFKLGEKYWREMNVEITKKFSKTFSLIFDYSYLEYNQNVIEGKSNPWDIIYANVFVADITTRLNQKNAIRTELQTLLTDQDQGDWATILIEYTYAPHWYIAVIDQYNFGNKTEDKRIHYFNVGGGYNNKGTRIGVSYGRQRAGIFCVGGVCRVVPASNGFYMSVTHSF